MSLNNQLTCCIAYCMASTTKLAACSLYCVLFDSILAKSPATSQRWYKPSAFLRFAQLSEDSRTNYFLKASMFHAEALVARR